MIQCVTLLTFFQWFLLIPTDHNVIEDWELAYDTVTDCDGHAFKRDTLSEDKCVFEFHKNNQYKRYIWGQETGGTYNITKNTLELNETYRKGGKTRKLTVGESP